MDFNRDFYRKYFFENKELPKLDVEGEGSLNWGKPPPPETEKKDDGML